MPRKCPSGKIRIHRKSSGTYYCAEDKGRPGRTPKQARVLPPISDDESLGYKVNASEATRRKQLRDAAKIKPNY